MLISVQGIVSRAVYTAFTLYMMLILLRWVAVYLQIDLFNPRLRWVTRLTDPLLRVVRRHVPNLGPWDISVVVALVVVFAARQAAVIVLNRIGV